MEPLWRLGVILAIDIGNTETVVGIYQSDRLIGHWRLSSNTPKTADECWILLSTWCRLKEISLSHMQGVVISSVVPSLTSVFKEVSKKYFKMDPLMVSSEIETGLEIQYDSPRTVGADRICNGVAGYEKYGGPLIVVDFGTATTFDVISENKAYLGGVIALGVQGASQELHRLAAKLPRVELVFPSSVVGRTTEASIQSGILWGTVALVDGVVDRIKNEMGWQETNVIATGGIAALIVNQSKQIQKVEPFLTLEGMKILFEENEKKQK